MISNLRICRTLTLGLAVTVFISACTQDPPKAEPTPKPEQPETSHADNPKPPAESAIDRSTSPSPQTENVDTDEPVDPDEPVAKDAPVEIQPLSDQMREKLLAARLDGGMQYSFRQFANMFLVTSRLHFATGIGLMTSSPEISKIELQSPFPSFYQPTLREFLDAIALQTFSEWKYDPTNKFVKSSVKGTGPIKDLAIFEFTKSKRERPFVVTLMDGWKLEDKGHWVMLIPPDFPVGMDIYEMGAYSTNDANDAQEFFEKVRADVALEWAQRVHKDAASDDMQPAKVGTYDALYYETMVPSQLKKDMRWRQWVFMVDNRCYFVVSTILPELDDEIFPDVEAMLTTFRAKQP